MSDKKTFIFDADAISTVRDYISCDIRDVKKDLESAIDWDESPDYFLSLLHIYSVFISYLDDFEKSLIDKEVLF